ncbi:MAG: endonuclease [Bacteroidetes bacterium]|nr:endonuclease [Bacteroidota bacterium]
MNNSTHEVMMFYNVENLFPPDPPTSHKFDPTPSGLRSWNEYRYNNKIFKIAYVIDWVAETYGKHPLTIGLSEISSSKVLEDLTAVEILKDRYDFVHFNSLDERGVDTALLFDREKVEVLHAEPITFLFEVEEVEKEEYIDTTRDVLWVKTKINSEIVNFFVLHLPSKREKDVNKAKRDYILQSIKEKAEELLQSNEATILCGDFNENPNEDSLRKLENNKDGKNIFFNPFVKLFHKKNFSTYYHQDGLLFDQFLLSPQFTQVNFPIKYEAAHVFNHQKLSSWDRKFQGRPFRTYVGSRYLGGYSDHYPVLVEISLQQQ